MNITGYDESRSRFVPLPSYTRDISIFAAVLVALVCVFGIAVNGFIMLVIAKTKKLHTVPNWLIFMMCATDVIQFSVVKPAQQVVTEVLHGWPFDYQSCSVFGFLAILFIALNLFNLCYMAINRYVLIVHQSAYQTIFSKKGTIALVVSSTAFVFIALLVPFTGLWGKYGYVEKTNACSMIVDSPNSSSFSLGVSVIGFVLPLLVMLYCYVRILIFVKLQQKKINGHNNGTKTTTMAVKKADVKLAKVMASIFLLYVACILPRMALNWIDPNNQYPMAHKIATAILLSYSLLNGIVFTLQNTQFKKSCLTFVGIDPSQVQLVEEPQSDHERQITTVSHT
ncbi:unnamed protein product [Owenia fusiformis]|uniref:Uncharacterized protein n=1 Tax=Owenia fusiformis TaxID=6347 RepID=A0A8J1XHP4_OWEFU|nr:unnamed protein product [Owenia fusiformis]